MRLLIHPNAHSTPKQIIKAALQTRQPSADHPIFCCVPRYQSWLQGPLDEAGFTFWGSQAVMVKHIAQKVEHRVPARQSTLEAQAVQGSTLVQGFSRPPNGSQRTKKN